MGFFTKMKNILFEEEDVTEEIKLPKKEKKKEVEKEEEPISHQVIPEKKIEEPVLKKEEKPENNFDTISERELFKSENTFPFPDFDEEEFSNSINNKPKPRNTNVLEYERKKRVETRTDYGRYERTEIKETTEKKKFKPSPIISPVYGILNEYYTIDDIKDKNEEKPDIDAVRKKAFEEPIEMIEEEPKKKYYEESVTVKVKEPEEEKQEKVKTIDELLEDTSDISIDTDDKKPVSKGKIAYDEIDEDLEELTKPEPEKEELNENEDTLENDLFDLIDSMYDSDENGEK